MPAEQRTNYSPGLEGVIAGETALCWVDPGAGLLYRGYDIHDLTARASFEEVAWLLLHGDLPGEEQLAEFSRQLAAERTLPGQVVAMLGQFPPSAHPMDMLRTGVSMLAAFDPELNDHSAEADLRKAVRLIAKVATLITDGWRVAHTQGPVAARPDLGHAANLLYCLTAKTPEPWQIKIMDTILVLYADHEFNASTFSARVTASTMADIYAAVTTGLGTLKGPLHGGANEDTMKMLRQIRSPDDVEAWVMERLQRREKITGFGHRVYKTGDSRVPTMRELARQLGQRYGQEHWVPVCERLESVMEREKKLCANVDLYAAPVFHLLGLPTELNTPIFAASRISGWCAHIIEQHQHNRLIRPRSFYIGPPRRDLSR